MFEMGMNGGGSQISKNLTASEWLAKGELVQLSLDKNAIEQVLFRDSGNLYIWLRKDETIFLIEPICHITQSHLPKDFLVPQQSPLKSYYPFLYLTLLSHFDQNPDIHIEWNCQDIKPKFVFWFFIFLDGLDFIQNFSLGSLNVMKHVLVLSNSQTWLLILSERAVGPAR